MLQIIHKIMLVVLCVHGRLLTDEVHAALGREPLRSPPPSRGHDQSHLGCMQMTCVVEMHKCSLMFSGL